MRNLLALAFVVLPSLTVARGEEPPTIPTGYDAYRQWEKWPQQRIGARAYMRSTYDRTGRNRRADASNFLYQTAEDFNVTLDLETPGILYFARYNHWLAARGTTKWTDAIPSSRKPAPRTRTSRWKARCFCRSTPSRRRWP